LTPEGAFLCGYAYSLSDPILADVAPGSLVPHGTPEAGGFGLSVTELGQGEGLVIYWRQLPGGYLFLRKGTAIEKIKIAGSPTEFKQAALQTIGKPIEILFGDKPLGRPDSITIMTGDDGKPAMAIARRGKDFSLSVLNVESVFHAQANLELNPDRKMHNGISVGDIKIQLAEDNHSATLTILQNGASVAQATLDATAVAKIVAHLGEMRAAMPAQIGFEPSSEPGTNELVIVNPTWRTDFSILSDLDGILMRLRHLGFGWLTFLLPYQEAKSLGDSLSKNAKEK
jgi:hypothetical protein